MLILGRDRMQDPSLGYARTFVRQVEDCLGIALERGVKIVSNAGGLNPAGLAEQLREVAARARASTRRSPRRGRRPARRADELGCGGRAHRQRLPRRLRHRRARSRPAPTSSSPAGSPTPRWSSGPAIWRARLDARRRTTSWPAPSSPATSSSAAPRPPAATSPASSTCPRDGRPLGFPIAEIAADGSSVITKHDGTGGAGHGRHRDRAADVRDPVARTTSAPTSPSTSTRSSSRRTGPTGCGSPASAGRRRREQLKVCVNELGGFRNQVEFVLDRPRHRGEGRLGARAARRRGSPAAVGRPGRWPRCPPPTPTPRRRASCLLRCVGQGPRRRPGRPGVHRRRGRARAGVLPRLHDDRPARHAGTPYGVYRPAYVDRDVGRRTTVHLPTARREVDRGPGLETERCGRPRTAPPGLEARRASARDRRRRHHPAGAARHLRARAVRRQGRRRQPRAVGRATGEREAAGRVAARLPDRRARCASCCPEAARPRRRGLRAAQPARAVNVVVRGLLGEGVAASTRFDPQAKGARRVGAVAARGHPGGAAVTSEFDDRLERASSCALQATTARVRAPRGDAAPAGVGGRRRGAARAAPGGGEGRAARRSASPRRSAAQGGDAARLGRRCRRRSSRPAVPRVWRRRCSPAASRCRTSPRTGTPDQVDALRAARRWPGR